jgi:signal transduction histidine kinase
MWCSWRIGPVQLLPNSADRHGAQAEVQLADGPALQVVFSIPVEFTEDLRALRTRVRRMMRPLRPLVHEIRLGSRESVLFVSLRTPLPTAIRQSHAEVPRGQLSSPERAAEEVPPDELRRRYLELAETFRELQLELDETNRGVVALYAELNANVDKLKQTLSDRKRLENDLRHRAEDLAAANRAKEDFLATLSHELRTPLNAILGWTRLLRLGKLDAAGVARALETIERNSHIQEQLISDLLELSRIVTGKMRVDLRPIELAPIVGAAIDAVRPAADAKAITLGFESESETAVLGDPDRLQQVVWNLLVNAIKFTPRGGNISVRIARSDSSAVITVSDTGEGISAELLPFIFDRFMQGDATVTRSHGGLGLGLSIVRHIVELHGGKVKARSDGLGSGATFSVHLPVQADAARDSHREPRAQSLSGIRAS